MANRASLLLMLQAFLLVLALSGCMPNVSGLEETTTRDAALAEPLPKSSFIRRQLVENPKKGKGLFFNTCVPSCLPGFTCCAGLLPFNFFCYNLLIDPLHCGSCTTTCPITAPICCFGKCSNILTDPNNCGFCGRKCPFAGSTCLFGICNYNGKIIL